MSKSITHNPDIGIDVPELQRFNEDHYVRQLNDTDGTVYMEDSRALALISRDTTHLGNESTPEYLDIEPTDGEYQSAERVRKETKSGCKEFKVWLFESSNERIAVKWGYIDMVRDLYDMSLDEIRRNAKIVENGEFSPLLIETDSEYRPLIMPYDLSSEKVTVL